MKKYDAFISHASEDKVEFVDYLFDALNDLGCSVWYDRFSIEYSDFFQTKIYEGIKNSRFGLFVITPNLTRKPEYAWVWQEFNKFLEKEKELSINVLIPIFYNITINDFQQYNNIPTLNKITERHSLQVFKDDGIFGVAEKLQKLFLRGG
ncbi:MAG: toll/interleukin-1 receptor domain-containing protein [Gloeotrichia echinulata DEX184]|nr:toll/interleukin-1 receptor domain-containing protein [Gloeotrichia echinulata DEX184]